MRQGEEVPKIPKVAAEDPSGEWRLYEIEDTFDGQYFRVYHKHDDGWYQQLTLMAVCGMCRAQAPKEMEGFKNLLKWER